MGAITFSLDPRLVVALQSALPLSVLVETGTFKGDTVESVKTLFKKIYTIELSPKLWAEAAGRFEDQYHVRVLYGNSSDRLRELRSELQDIEVLYWLDAHWCIATSTAGEKSQCDLLGELAAIGGLNEKSVVLIDDARLFLAPPPAPHETAQWPHFSQIISQLSIMSSDHELMVINDVIVFFPKRVKVAVESYARNCGVDWLHVANYFKENGSAQQLEINQAAINEKDQIILMKERHIRELSKVVDILLARNYFKENGSAQQLEINQAAINEKDQIILMKEQHIRELSKILGIYRAIFSIPVLGQMLQVLKRISIIIRPRLGVFNQYPPRALTRQRTKLAVKDDAKLTPKISIVTPSYQQGEFIERTINSVLNQGYKNLEYFIQDGGSKDITVDVIRRYEAKLAGWQSEEDSGQSQAINRGFQKTNGEIMAWLNSDDLLLPDTLIIVAEYFKKHPRIDVLYGNRILVDENDMEIGRWIMPGHDEKVLSWADYVPQETMFWRRRIWDKVGGQIDESFRFAMDWDLLVRFREAGANFAHIPNFLGAFRIHDRQKTSAAINEIGFQEMDRIRERLLGRVPSKKEIRKAVAPFLLKHVFIDKIYGLKTRLGRQP